MKEYSTSEVLNLILKKLDEKKIVYTIEEKKNSIIIWFDRENNFLCNLYKIGADVHLLKGGVGFNLREGKEDDLHTINDIVEHIYKLMFNDLFQVEMYKNKKLCSVRQYIVVDGKKINCSCYVITHVLFFVPFLKKEFKEVHYFYKNTK